MSGHLPTPIFADATFATLTASGGTLSGTFSGSPTFSGTTVTFTNNATVGGTLGVTGNTTFTGTTLFNNMNTVANGHSFNFADASGNNSRFIAAGNAFQFSGTNAAGTQTGVWTFPLHVDAPNFTWQVPQIISAPAAVWSGTTSSSALTVTQNSSGTTTGTEPALVKMTLTDTIDASGAHQPYVQGMALQQNYGGGTTKGGRTGLNVLLVQQGGATTDTGADHYYVGMSAYSYARFSPPGATAAAPLGRVFGMNSVGYIQDGFVATNYYEVCSIECDVGISAGSTAALRTGVAVVGMGTSQGYWTDSGVWLYSTGSGSQFRTGVLYGDQQPWPIEPTSGSMLAANYGASYDGSLPMAAKWGIDFGQVAFPATGNPYEGGFLRSKGFGVDGNGTLQLGTTCFTSSASGLAIDAKGSVGTAAAIAVAGAGYLPSGEVFTTPYGGVFRIGITAGIPTGAVTVITPPTVSSTTPPSNPIAATSLATKSQGAGLTLNLTWNTTATALSLQPTGGMTTLGGLAKLKSFTVATLPAAAAGNAGCVAYVTDATAPTYRGTLTGGGTVKCMVFSDGTAWSSS